MMKKFLAWILAATLVIGLVPAASAKLADVPQKEKAAVLKELEIMVGDETGSLHLENAVTRAEFAKLTVAASPYKDAVGETALTDPYPDVSHKDWFAPYVRAAADGGLVKGDLAGYFRPQRTITLGEGVTMVLRLLGYQDGDFSAPWPTGQLALYRSLDLDEGLLAKNQDDLLTRQDCLHLFYNLLTASAKTGSPYLMTLGHTLNQDGEVDVPALFKVEQEGPVPLTGNWQSLLPFEVSDALIYRDNDRAELADLREWDVLYWAKDQAILFAFSQNQGSMGQVTGAVEGPVTVGGSWQAQLPFSLDEVTSVTKDGVAATVADITPGQLVYWSKYTKALYVYSRKVSGTVEAVPPSPASPTAVTVGGVTYPLETFAAQYAFSDLGSFRRGDMVTLSMGRGGGVAAVSPLETHPEEKIGVVASIGASTYLDSANKPYSAKTVTVTATDGVSYTYPWWDENLEAGDLVRVTFDSQGASLSQPAAQSLTGTVNQSATKLGALVLAPNVEILDTYGDHTAASVPASRLAGVTLKSGDVRCYATDAQGVVTALILNNVTGDLHTYGVLTEANIADFSSPYTGMVLQGAYTLDIMGQTQVIPVEGKKFPVEEGPVVLMMDGQTVDKLKNLTPVKDVTLSGQTALQGSAKYTLSDRVSCYLYDKEEKEYTLATRNQITTGGYALTAWYDSPDQEGGRVRVIVAQSK